MEKGSKNGIGNISAWAYALGCAVGWGSFMNPTNIFLPVAGPLGSAIGIAIASVMVLFIGMGISYMAKSFPESSGVHVYIGKVLGADHGFLSAWAMLLAYLSIMWANATAIILLIRFVWGGVLQFGFYYEVAGYEVYFGEILFAVAAIVLAGILAIFGRTGVRIFHSVCAILQVGLVVVIFIGVLAFGHASAPGTFGFADVGVSDGMEIFNVAMLAPWMFVGFEAVTYMINSGGRRAKGIDIIISVAIVCGMLAYALPMLIPVLGMPDGYADWMTYLEASKQASGLLGLPVFYSVYYTLGDAGLYILVVAIICAIVTSLFGLFRVTSRLISTMAEEGLAHGVFAKTNKNGEPYAAMLLVMAISVIVPFFGRTAIVWIVDVTTISATIVYVYSSVCALRLATVDKSATLRIRIISVIGAVFSVISFLFLLIPNVVSENKLATESYLILTVWSIVGLLYYWIVFRRDKNDVYGKSTVMWMGMLFLLFFSAIMWVRQRIEERLSVMMVHDLSLHSFLNSNSFIELLVVLMALFIMFSLFTTLLRREREKDRRVMESEAKNAAKTAFLSNMSHDIRTPMNAILGFTDLALDSEDKDQIKDYLEKIKGSGNHLLSLTNDVLEMSRIESGKIDMHAAPMNIKAVFADLESILKAQAQARNQTFTVDTSGVSHENVICDKLRLNQVLFNLTSNAIKYTPEGGKIVVSVREIGGFGDSVVTYEISVKDNGIGMTPEFAAKVFDAFERDKDAELKGIQGTGLGMAITKRIVELMGGDIRVETVPDEGSNFIVELSLDICYEADVVAAAGMKADESDLDFSGKRVLLVDDIEINREIAVATLEMFGLEVEEAVDGQDAFEKVDAAEAGHYDVVLMDIQMPIMDGYEAARAIRGISDPKKAGVPIIAMTANAFQEDIENAEKAGMNGHVAKPIDRNKLAEQLTIVFWGG